MTTNETPDAVDSGAASELHAPDTASAAALDAAIASAMDGPSETAETPADDTAREYHRDEHGRFKALEETTPRHRDGPEPEDVRFDDQGEHVEEEASEEEPADAQTPEWDEATFTDWSEEDRTAFNEIPAEHQARVLALVQGANERASGHLTEWQQFGEQVQPLIETVSPYAERYARDGLDPNQVIGSLCQINDVLTYGTWQEKVNALQQIAQRTQVPIEVVGADPFADATQPGSESFPLLHDLRQQNQQLMRELQAVRDQQAQLQQQQESRSVEQFAAMTNSDGSRKYPFVEAVQGTVREIMGRYGKSFEEAYKIAAKPHEDMLANELKRRGVSVDRNRQQAVEKAKKARPTKSTGLPSGGSTKATDLDSILNQTMSQAGY